MITFPVFRGLFLTDFFRHIIPCQTDQSCQHIEHQNRNSDTMVHSHTVCDQCRTYTKTDNICQRINLNSKLFLHFSTIFFRPCDLSIKHIAKSGQCQTDNRHPRITIHRKQHSSHRNQYTYISQHYCIIIYT